MSLLLPVRKPFISDTLSLTSSYPQDYEKGREPLGRVLLVAYYVARAEADGGSEAELTVQAYPKPLSLRAKSSEEADAWLAAFMKPLADLGVPHHGWDNRGGTGGAPVVMAATSAAAAAGAGQWS